MKTLPSKQDILDWITANPGKTSKRDISKAFGVKGALKIDLKRLLKNLTDEGYLTKKRRTYNPPNALPSVSVLRVLAPDQDGDLWAIPAEWAAHTPPPKINIIPQKDDPALKEADRILCKLRPSSDPDVMYEARLIRRIGTGLQKLLGVYRLGSEGGRIVPVDKKIGFEWQVAKANSLNVQDGELVEAERIDTKPRFGLPRARITKCLGNPAAPKAVSLIAVHHHSIPDDFPDTALAEANVAKPAPLGDRTDLRDLPFVTIDPADARDHDDAVCAFPDERPENKDGHIVWVAIADVAYYVPSGSALDEEARKRGNSTYFPDRVVPMLPEILSNGLCSLQAGEERACIAVRIVLDAKGHKLDHAFHRGIIRSQAALSYQQAQKTAEGKYDTCTEPLAPALSHLYAAYKATQTAQAMRQPLHLDLPERQIVLSDEGHVTSIAYKERLDAHKLIEDFMVLANVCAAETLETHRQPFLYRAHETPAPEKLEALRETASSFGVKFAKGQVLKPQNLNKILDAMSAVEDKEVINMAVLRAMKQAYYSPENYGHFGLNLKRYAHFTSPIRRYADLIVHRALIAAHGWGEDGLTDADAERLPQTADWISDTERRSMQAERETTERYIAAFLADRVGATFAGRVSGIAKAGLFVRLKDTGADGIVPLGRLGQEYWRYNVRDGTLKGKDSGRLIAVGMPCTVSLVDASFLTGGLELEVLELDGKPMPKGPAKKSVSRHRKLSKSKAGRRRARKPSSKSR